MKGLAEIRRLPGNWLRLWTESQRRLNRAQARESGFGLVTVRRPPINASSQFRQALEISREAQMLAKKRRTSSARQARR